MDGLQVKRKQCNNKCELNSTSVCLTRPSRPVIGEMNQRSHDDFRSRYWRKDLYGRYRKKNKQRYNLKKLRRVYKKNKGACSTLYAL